MWTEEEERRLFETGRMLAEVLKKDTPLLRQDSMDGRTNSAISEATVKDHIRSLSIGGSMKDIPYNATFKYPKKERAWYDLEISTHEPDCRPTSAFVNIKISTGKTADNVSSKKGMTYALTGLDDGIGNGSSWQSCTKFIKENPLPPEMYADYYFLLVFKGEERGSVCDVVFQSLRRLSSLIPNGSNPPFQCKWSENKVPVLRTLEESDEFIKGAFVQSMRKRIQGAHKAMECFL